MGRQASRREVAAISKARGAAPRHPEEGWIMFEQALDSLKTATEANLHMQQEVFKKWFTMWPGVPAFPGAGAEPFTKFQKKWADFVAEVAKKQREAIEAQYKVGVADIEKAFRLNEVKDPGELCAKTTELWHNAFEVLRQTYETQLRDLQAAAAKWTELAMKVVG
jgi:hypothetical protein